MAYLNDEEFEKRLNSVDSGDSTVMWLLGLLDRPRNALASGVYNLTDDDDKTGFVRGLGQGWRGDREVNWTDVLGLPEPQDDDDWAPYLGKGAMKLGLDIVGDPLNLVPLGLLGNVVGKGVVKGGKAFAGSGAGKLFSHYSWDEPVEEAIRAIRREGSEVPIRQTVEKAQTDFEDILSRMDPEEQGFIRNNIVEAIERPDRVPEISPDVLAPFEELLRLDRAKFDEMNRLRVRHGLKAKAPIDEDIQRYFPRIESGEGRLKSAGLVMGHKPFEQHGREILRWVDPQTGDDLFPEPLIGKASSLGIKEDGGRYIFQGQEVVPTQATFREAKGVAPDRMWLEDPFQAYYQSTKRKQGRINYLKTLEEMKDLGKLKPLMGDAAPTGWRPLKIKGFDDLIAPKNVANRLENLAGAMYDTEKLTGVLEQAVIQTMNSKVGQLFRQYTNEWKRGVLGLHPGYYFANIISNFSLQYMADPKSLASLPAAIKLRHGGKGQVIKGIDNKDLLQEFRIRDIADTRVISKDIGLEIGDDLTRGMDVPLAKKITEPFGKAGEYALKGHGAWVKANEAVMATLGAYPEEYSKMAVALRHLKQTVKGTPTPNDLDAAAQKAKDFLFDYSPEELTIFEMALKNYLPFVTWFRSIMGRTIEDVVTQPGRLAGLGRIWDFTFTPLEQGMLEAAPDWIKENAPAQGFFGGKLKSKEEGLPMVFQTGRFQPHGTVQQFLSRPTEFGLNLLNPLLKASFSTLGNWDYFKKRPIDPVAGSGLEALFNPIKGGPYSLAEDKSLLGQALSPLGIGEGGYMPAMWQQQLESTLPIGRHMGAIDTLLEGEAWETPGRSQMAGTEKAAWWGLGGKAFPFDETRYTYRKNMLASRQLKSLESLVNRALSRGDYEKAAFFQDLLEKEMIRQEQSRHLPTEL